MSFAYMPIYTGDYVRDTRHLSPQEHGCYFLLLMHCWDTQGPVPLDERRICAILNARSGDEIETVRRVLAEFFVKMDDGYYNKRIMEEIERHNSISSKRKDAADKRWAARDAIQRMQLHSKSNANAKQVQSNSTIPIPNPNPNPKEDSKTLSGKPDVSALKADAKAILAFLNAKAGRAYRENDANLDFIVARLREGYTPQECKQVVAKKCREWSADEKMAEYLRPATLFNRTKFNQYAGELVVPQESPNA